MVKPVNAQELHEFRRTLNDNNGTLPFDCKHGHRECSYSHNGPCFTEEWGRAVASAEAQGIEQEKAIAFISGLVG